MCLQHTRRHLAYVNKIPSINSSTKLNKCIEIIQVHDVCPVGMPGKYGL
jgi:hypothetical protein